MRIGLSILFCLLSALCWFWAVPSQARQPVLIAEYASGDRFWLEPDSFRVMDGGLLQYQVRSDHRHNPNRIPTSTVTLNQVDCRTGLYQSYLEAWDYDAQGRLVDDRRMMPNNILLARHSALYFALKSACEANFPTLSLHW
jgi:hypothetical protein